MLKLSCGCMPEIILCAEAKELRVAKDGAYKMYERAYHRHSDRLYEYLEKYRQAKELYEAHFLRRCDDANSSAEQG